MRLFFLTTASVLVMMTGMAYADAIADRQALMKDMGRSVGTIAPMVKGEKPFDANAALTALETIAEDTKKLDADTLFPEGSDKGDTEASAKIWEDKAGFGKHIEKFRTDAAAAAAAKPQDVDALKLAFQQVAPNCGSCHQAYRIKKD